MASVASQLIEEVTAHAQSYSLEDARKICADGTYFPNNLRVYIYLLPPLSAYLKFQPMAGSQFIYPHSLALGQIYPPFSELA